ncbi:MAG: ornithine cyclodeaminase family protein [Deltaproteobacteria bacterium]|nr:ornithine cyclodeaminase family protein [Deltaproteobacteria bacterium]
MLIINNQTVEKILDMKGCLEALEIGYKDLSQDRARYRPRIDLFAPNDDPELMFRWGTMEGASRTLETFAIRMKSDMLHWPDGKTVEKYSIEPGTYCGLILVFSTRNAEPLAMLNDGIIQHMRVGACAGLGARVLARTDASVVGMLGSGGMARSYLEAFHEIRDLTKVKIYSPTKAHREAFAREMSAKLNLEVIPDSEIKNVVQGSDIVATCTDSIEVVVQNKEWIQSGVHLTCVRPNEWSPEIVDECDLVIKLGRGTILKLDEEMQRIAGYAAYVAGTPSEMKRIREPTVDLFEKSYPTLTDIMSGKVKGRTSREQKTFFVNDGTQGLQFAAVAGYVVHKAKELGLGQEVPTDWFTQDIRD